MEEAGRVAAFAFEEAQHTNGSGVRREGISIRLERHGTQMSIRAWANVDESKGRA